MESITLLIEELLHFSYKWYFIAMCLIFAAVLLERWLQTPTPNIHVKVSKKQEKME
jgi:hypothetical protein